MANWRPNPTQSMAIRNFKNQVATGGLDEENLESGRQFLKDNGIPEVQIEKAFREGQKKLTNRRSRRLFLEEQIQQQ